MTGRLALVSAAVAIVLASPVGTAQVNDFTPVTDAMLQHPDAADWLSWRRTLDGQAHSPLDQITTENVGRLRLTGQVHHHGRDPARAVPLGYLPGASAVAVDHDPGEVPRVGLPGTPCAGVLSA